MSGIEPRSSFAQAWFELRSVLSNGEQQLLNLALPLAALFIIRQRSDAAQLLQLVVFGAILASNFTGTAIATAFDRRQGSLKSLALTPLGKSGLVAGKSLAGAATALLQFGLLFAAAWEFGIAQQVPPTFWLAAPLLAVACQGWALTVAARLRAEAVLAASNGLLVLLAATAYQFRAGGWALLNPLAAATASATNNPLPWLALVLHATVAVTAAVRTLRWD